MRPSIRLPSDTTADTTAYTTADTTADTPLAESALPTDEEYDAPGTEGGRHAI